MRLPRPVEQPEGRGAIACLQGQIRCSRLDELRNAAIQGHGREGLRKTRPEVLQRGLGLPLNCHHDLLAEPTIQDTAGKINHTSAKEVVVGDAFVISTSVMSENLTALRLFVRVARTGSFSRAGRELDVPQPSVSRVIASLEREVGCSLLIRSTRAVVLTDAGHEYLSRIEPILSALEEANQAMRGTGELQGILRVGLPSSLALREVVPKLGEFMDQHPSLRMELVMEDRRQDLLKEGVDVAIRLGPLTDSGLIARRIGMNQRLLVASPAYLAKAGTPAAPTELVDHSVIIGPPGVTSRGWVFERKGRQASIRVQGRLVTTLNEGATAAAVAGLGIVSMGHLGCRAELEDGRLVQVLADWEMAAEEVNAIYAAGRMTKPSARAFVEFLHEQMKA